MLGEQDDCFQTQGRGLCHKKTRIPHSLSLFFFLCLSLSHTLSSRRLFFHPAASAVGRGRPKPIVTKRRHVSKPLPGRSRS